MKVNRCHLHRSLFILFLFLLPAVSIAAVKEVTFFPNSAKVSETAILHPLCDKNQCRSVIALPPQADPESLVVTPAPESRIKIDDVQIKSVQVQDETRIAALRKQIAGLQDERKEKQAKLQALETQLEFWQAQTKAKTKTVADSYKLAEAIGKNVRIAAQEKSGVETQLEKIDKNLKTLQEELNQAAGRKEAAWEATLTMSASDRKEINLSYSYLLSGCGWLPLYRLEALPADGNVSFSWEAEVWQSSGADWRQVRVNLATLQPVANVNPPEMPEWIVKRRTLYKAPQNRNIDAGVLMQKGDAAEEVSGAAPVETGHTTYSIWSLGEKNISAGDRQRLQIQHESWPAEFVFLARPSLSPQAFVRALIKPDKPVEIPSGQAIFIVDGAVLGKREFSFAGSEGVLFFGTTPLVSVTSVRAADQTGTTIFQDRQTRNWQWLIEAKNSGSSDIKLRIEEPLPQTRDKRIKLNFRQNPEPAEKDHSGFVWLLEVPAGQKKTIQNNIELEAPADMNIDFGWRQ